MDIGTLETMTFQIALDFFSASFNQATYSRSSMVLGLCALSATKLASRY